MLGEDTGERSKFRVDSKVEIVLIWNLFVRIVSLYRIKATNVLIYV